MKTLRENNRGAALVYVLLTVTFAGILGTGLMMLILNQVRSLAVDEAKAREYYIADGAMEILVAERHLAGAEPVLTVFAEGINETASGDIAVLLQEAPIDEPEMGEKYLYCTLDEGEEDIFTVVYYGDKYRTEIVYTDGDSPTYTCRQVLRVDAEGGDAA